jgi:hypothetical protein
VTKKDLVKLIEFQTEATEADFIRIFGERLGAHLWGKYRNMGYDLLGLISALDAINLDRFVKGFSRITHRGYLSEPESEPAFLAQLNAELFA